ncbi:MAG: hypothetical protein WC082_15530, partial [Victivallales bacterium]
MEIISLPPVLPAQLFGVIDGDDTVIITARHTVCRRGIKAVFREKFGRNTQRGYFAPEKHRA